MLAQPYDQLSDLVLLELCIWRESRGEPFDGKRAVAHVVRNRVYSNIQWWGRDWHSVILHPYQFSSFNASDPNADLWPNDTDPSWADSCQSAIPVFSGTDSDSTGGALWYKVTSLPWPAGWGDPALYELSLAVGKQSFYRPATNHDAVQQAAAEGDA